MSKRHRAVHLHNMPSRAEGIIVIEAGKDPVGNLLDDELVVALTLFSPPEDPVRMPFHVFDVPSGVLILFLAEFDRKAGFDFLSVHNCARLQYLCRFEPPILPKRAMCRQAFARLRAFLFAIGTMTAGESRDPAVRR